MVIGVEAGCLGVQDERLKVGVFQVAKNLLLELSRQDKKNRYILYSFYPIDKTLMKSLGSRFTNIVVKPPRGWMKIWLPLRLMKDRPDIFVGLSQSLPLRLPGSNYKAMAIVYDLAYEKFPEFYKDCDRLQKNTSYMATHAERIITISNHAKNDLIKRYPVAENKTEVVYLGVCPYPKRTQFKSINPYFLFVGALKPAKNLPTVLKAFGLFGSKSNKPYDLLIVGGDKWLDEKIHLELETLPSNIKKHVHFLGVVPDNKLWELYRGATALLMPSMYEGFGLPAVEAMAAGCPVIASNAGALPEIIGDAGLLGSPKDEKKLAGYMLQVSSDMKLRNKIKGKGIQKAKQYTWVSFATKLLGIITSV